MNIVKSITNFLTKSADKTVAIFYDMTTTPISGVSTETSVLQTSYTGNPHVFSVIDESAKVAASLPWKIIRNDTGGELNNTELTQLLSNPAPNQGYWGLVYIAITHLLANGNIYLHPLTPIGFTNPSQLRFLQPDNVSIELDNTIYRDIRNYNYIGKVFLPDEVIHAIMPDATSNTTGYGRSPFASSLKAIRASNEIFNATEALFRNRGTNGILTSDSGAAGTGIPFSEGEQKRIQGDFDIRNMGSKMFGKIMTTIASLKYIPMGMPFNDLQALGLSEKNMRTIFATIGAPSQLFNDVSASTYSNFKEAQKAFMLRSVLPYIQLFHERLSHDLIQGVFNEDASIVVDKSEIEVLQEEQETPTI